MPVRSQPLTAELILRKEDGEYMLQMKIRVLTEKHCNEKLSGTLGPPGGVDLVWNKAGIIAI